MEHVGSLRTRLLGPVCVEREEEVRRKELRARRFSRAGMTQETRAFRLTEREEGPEEGAMARRFFHGHT
jgi:hypothetical protein